jgi:plastocyanin
MGCRIRKFPAFRRTILPRIALSVVLLAGDKLLGQAPAPVTGRIEGAVTLSSELTGRRRTSRPYTVRGQTVSDRSAPDTNELQHVVVYVEGVPAVTSARPGATMVQAGQAFAPHVLPIVAGTTVEFPNSDPIFHNVFSLSRTRSFDLGRYPQGASKRIRFDRPGVIQVFCHIHADMSAVILVLENSWFALADSAGNFAIEGLPPGEYRVVAWHERIRPVVKTVRVSAGAASRIDYQIPLTAPND